MESLASIYVSMETPQDSLCASSVPSVLLRVLDPSCTTSMKNLKEIAFGVILETLSDGSPPEFLQIIRVFLEKIIFALRTGLSLLPILVEMYTEAKGLLISRKRGSFIASLHDLKSRLEFLNRSQSQIIARNVLTGNESITMSTKTVPQNRTSIHLAPFSNKAELLNVISDPSNSRPLSENMKLEVKSTPMPRSDTVAPSPTATLSIKNSLKLKPKSFVQEALHSSATTDTAPCDSSNCAVDAPNIRLDVLTIAPVKERAMATSTNKGLKPAYDASSVNKRCTNVLPGPTPRLIPRPSLLNSTSNASKSIIRCFRFNDPSEISTNISRHKHANPKKRRFVPRLLTYARNKLQNIFFPEPTKTHTSRPNPKLHDVTLNSSLSLVHRMPNKIFRPVKIKLLSKDAIHGHSDTRTMSLNREVQSSRSVFKRPRVRQDVRSAKRKTSEPISARERVKDWILTNKTDIDKSLSTRSTRSNYWSSPDHMSWLDDQTSPCNGLECGIKRDFRKKRIGHSYRFSSIVGIANKRFEMPVSSPRPIYSHATFTTTNTLATQSWKRTRVLPSNTDLDVEPNFTQLKGVSKHSHRGQNNKLEVSGTRSHISDSDIIHLNSENSDWKSESDADVTDCKLPKFDILHVNQTVSSEVDDGQLSSHLLTTLNTAQRTDHGFDKEFTKWNITLRQELEKKECKTEANSSISGFPTNVPGRCHNCAIRKKEKPLLKTDVIDLTTENSGDKCDTRPGTRVTDGNFSNLPFPPGPFSPEFDDLNDIDLLPLSLSSRSSTASYTDPTDSYFSPGPFPPEFHDLNDIDSFPLSLLSPSSTASYTDPTDSSTKTVVEATKSYHVSSPSSDTVSADSITSLFGDTISEKSQRRSESNPFTPSPFWSFHGTEKDTIKADFLSTIHDFLNSECEEPHQISSFTPGEEVADVDDLLSIDAFITSSSPVEPFIDEGLSDAFDDASVTKAYLDCLNDEKVTPLLKEELKLKIQQRQLMQGLEGVQDTSEENLQCSGPYEPSDEERRRRERKRILNKESAERCRKKEKEQEDQLLKVYRGMCVHNGKLREEIETLEKERRVLEMYLVMHNCKKTKLPGSVDELIPYNQGKEMAKSLRGPHLADLTTVMVRTLEAKANVNLHPSCVCHGQTKEVAKAEGMKTTHTKTPTPIEDDKCGNTKWHQIR